MKEREITSIPAAPPIHGAGYSTKSSVPGRESAHGENRAFALAELVVVLAVIVVLAGMLLPAYASTMRKAGLLECKNNLRQAGMAIGFYARDNRDSLPGPLWIAAFCSYQGSGAPNTPTTWSMAHYLAAYFGLPAPDGMLREVPVLVCPAAFQAKRFMPPAGNPSYGPVYYISNTRIINKPGGSFPRDAGSTQTPSAATNFYWPFGHPGTPFSPPAKTSHIRRPSEQWAITDIDKTNAPSGSTYYSYLPTPVHYNIPASGRQAKMIMRNYLYFDGSVRPVQTSN